MDLFHQKLYQILRRYNTKNKLADEISSDFFELFIKGKNGVTKLFC